MYNWISFEYNHINLIKSPLGLNHDWIGSNRRFIQWLKVEPGGGIVCELKSIICTLQKKIDDGIIRVICGITQCQVIVSPRLMVVLPKHCLSCCVMRWYRPSRRWYRECPQQSGDLNYWLYFWIYLGSINNSLMLAW